MQTPQLSRNVRVEPHTPENAKKLRYKTTVFLRRDQAKPRMFFCPNCQNPILKYHGGQVEMIVPGDGNDDGEGGESALVFPIIIYCKNGPCDAIYVFEGWAR